MKTTSADVTVDGCVNGNVTTMSGDVHVEGDCLGGSITTMSGNVSVSGNHDGAISSTTGRIRTTKKRTRATAASVTSRPTARRRK